MANSYYNNTRTFLPGTLARGDVVDNDLDAVTTGFDLVEGEMDQAVRFTNADVPTPIEFSENATSRADTAIGFDVNGSPVLHNSASANADAAAASAAAASTSEANAATSESNAATSASNASTSETNAASSASAASTSETNAAASASAASTSETNAGTSETNAAASASAASTSETNAATSASNASTSETNAATSETNAGNSETAALAAQAAAEAAYDSFDDRYLGSKTSDPTLDNDGNPLLDGALYWNTTSNEMRVYDLGGTSWVAAYVPAGNYLLYDTTAQLTVGYTTDIETLSSNTITPSLALEGLKKRAVDGNVTINDVVGASEYGACQIWLDVGTGGPYTITLGAGVYSLGSLPTLEASTDYLVTFVAFGAVTFVNVEEAI